MAPAPMSAAAETEAGGAEATAEPSPEPSADPSESPEPTPDITPVPSLGQVTGLHMEKGTESTMAIAWDAVQDALYYEVYVSEEADGTYILETETDMTAYTFENLVRGKLLYVKVRAMSEELTGEESDVMAIAPVPGKVSGVRSVKNNVRTKISLQWDEAEGATGYAVFYKSSATEEYIRVGTTTELSIQVTGLTAAKDYYFIVYAYAADESNMGEGSDEALFGTAPALPKLTKVKGGDRRVKVYWSKGTGAQIFRIYVSTSADSGFVLRATVAAGEYMLRGIDDLLQNKTYYVKVQAVRTVSGMEMISDSETVAAKTVKASATSTKAKKYTTKKKFKKSPAYKKYKAFSKRIVYGKSFVLPGMRNTNVAGFNAARMVPQGIAFAGNYMLISAYDYLKVQESVIYIMDKNTRKYITTLVLPHTGHVGGITYDGTNVWVTYGKNIQSFRYSLIVNAALSKRDYVEMYTLMNTCPVSDTASYVSYYKGKLWVGAYNEKSKKYLYGYDISNKEGVPALTMTNRILMPNRTQGVAFTSGGKMLVSRSCQTKKGKSGFMSRIDVYMPTWNLKAKTIKKNKLKKKFSLPPMNEGIAINGAYTYVIYESVAFADCEAPVDRITAFKTSKIS